MMLRYSFGMEEAADAIDRAVESVLDSGVHTADIAIDRDRGGQHRGHGRCHRRRIAVAVRRHAANV